MPRNSFIIGQKHVVFFPEYSSKFHQLADHRLTKSRGCVVFYSQFSHEFLYSLLKNFGHLWHFVAKFHSLTSCHATTYLSILDPSPPSFIWNAYIWYWRVAKQAVLSNLFSNLRFYRPLCNFLKWAFTCVQSWRWRHSMNISSGIIMFSFPILLIAGIVP